MLLCVRTVTTLRPQLGTLSFADDRSISVADLPGVIEGAHVGRGAGHQFLRHAERAHLLLLVVDLFGFQLRASGSSGSRLTPFRSAIETLALLNRVRRHDST